MKFSLAWAKVAAQNVTLKVATAVLAGVAVAQGVILSDLALKPPIVIERGCFMRAAVFGSPNHSADEIKSFLKEVLPLRFDSDAVVRPELFSLEELAFREKEQESFKQKQMSQRFLLGDAQVTGKEITVSADRLITVGKVKSVLPLNLKITVKSVPRTESNPYGLVLAQVSQSVEEKQEQKE